MLEVFNSEFSKVWLSLGERDLKICAKIISHALTHDKFKPSDIIPSMADQADYQKNLQLLMKANVLSDLGSSHSIHYGLVKSFFNEARNKKLLLGLVEGWIHFV
jgi:catalase (peroxidase I)